MFGGRRKQEEFRAMEKELLSRQVILDRYSQTFSHIRAKNRDTESMLDTFKSSREEMDQQLTKVIDAVNCSADHTRKQKEQSCEIQEQMYKISEGVEQTEVSYWEMTEKLKQQKENMLDAVEQNKNITAPAEFLSKISVELQEELNGIGNQIGELDSMGRQMGVLSLNAAIEAGRMGESGREFVAAAEDVRNLAGQYQQITVSFSEAIEKINSTLEEVKEQTAQLNTRLKDYNIQIGKGTKEFADCVSQMEDSDIQSFTTEIKNLAERVSNMITSEDECIRQYSLATNAMEQAGESFMKQQGILEQIEGSLGDIKEQVKAEKLK